MFATHEIKLIKKKHKPNHKLKSINQVTEFAEFLIWQTIGIKNDEKREAISFGCSCLMFVCVCCVIYVCVFVCLFWWF